MLRAVLVMKYVSECKYRLLCICSPNHRTGHLALQWRRPGAILSAIAVRRPLVWPHPCGVLLAHARVDQHWSDALTSIDDRTTAGEELVDVLRGRILRGIEAGALHAGDRLPSAREWAGELGLDHRVVLAAVRQLAGEGLVETRERGGIYLSNRQHGGGIPPLPEPWIVDVLAQGLTREIPVPELSEWLRRCTETLRLRAAVVTTTEDQALGLCRELRDDFGLDADAVTPAELPEVDGAADVGSTSVPLPLRRADLIVTTRAHESRVRELGALLHKPVIATDVRPDLVTGEWALLLRKPVYAVVASQQFGEMLRRFFADVPGVDNLRIVVLGEDDVSTIPPGAPTYVTQHVRAQLAGTHIPGQILPAARTIAAASAREILTFVVRSNLEALRRLAR